MHLEPSLKLIEKAKNKVKKKFWFYVEEKEIKKLCLGFTNLNIEKPLAKHNCQIAEIELEVEE